MYSEIHENDNDLIPFILETKYNPTAQRLGNYAKAGALLLISTSQLANHNYDSVPLTLFGPGKTFDISTRGGRFCPPPLFFSKATRDITMNLIRIALLTNSLTKLTIEVG